MASDVSTMRPFRNRAGMDASYRNAAEAELAGACLLRR